jgi:hypothetical protein
MRRHAVHEAMAAATVVGLRGVARSTPRYRPARDDGALRARLETLAVVKPRWGYRRLHWLLGREGWMVNRKRSSGSIGSPACRSAGGSGNG